MPVHDAKRRSRGGRDFALGLFGVFGCGNFGNDATLEACLLGVERYLPKSRIACIATNPVPLSRAYGIASFPIAVSPNLAGGGRGVFGRVRRGLGESRESGSRMAAVAARTNLRDRRYGSPRRPAHQA